MLARTVVVATGARWRQIEADGVRRLAGSGVYYAAMPTDAERCRQEDVIVVAAATRPGRRDATLPLARRVRVVVCGDGLAASMSRYLLDRIDTASNVDVMSDTEVVAAHGDERLEAVDLRDRTGASSASGPTRCS